MYDNQGQLIGHLESNFDQPRESEDNLIIKNESVLYPTIEYD